jgi:hypothetical protein
MPILACSNLDGRVGERSCWLAFEEPTRKLTYVVPASSDCAQASLMEELSIAIHL